MVSVAGYDMSHVDDSMKSVPYVVGVSPNSPANPHSALASGGNDIAHIDSSPEQEAYILYGILIHLASHRTLLDNAFPC